MRIDDSAGALKQALDVAGARHSLLTRNLANLETPGYVRQDLDFEAALRDLNQDGQPFNPMGHLVQGGAPELNKEAGAMAETDAFYTTCTRLLQLNYQMLHASLKDR